MEIEPTTKDDKISKLVNTSTTEDLPRIMHNLALTYSALGMNDKALEMKEATLAMRRRILPEDHPDIALSMGNLASTYSALGMVDKALEMQEATLSMRRRTLPEDHPYIASSMNNLAYIYSALGMNDKALELMSMLH